MWRFIGLVLLLMGLLGAALYFKGPAEKLATAEGAGEAEEVGEANKVTTKLDIGVPTPRQPTPAGSLVALREPILVTGSTLSAIAEQPVGARTDGKLQENHAQLGDRVARGQILGQMDESLARLTVEAARVKAESDASIMTAFNKMNATREMFIKEQQLGRQGAQQDLIIKEFQAKEAQQEYVKAIEEREEAKRLFAQKRHELELLKLRSDINGEVVKVYKKPGAPVRGGEPLYEVVDTDRLWVEALMPREAAAELRPGMRVRVEPERLEAPVRELRYHTAPIAGLAVSPDSHLLASVGEDGKVVVWDWRAGKPLWIGRDKNRLVEFLSVAFSPVVVNSAGNAQEYKLLVGGADGVARLWTFQMDAQRRFAMTSEKEIKADAGGHVGRIQALAFSPDGRYAATGGADFQIILWNIATGKQLYKVQARKGSAPAHRGFITTLQFTPDRHLVSAATDKTIKRWALGDQSAQLVATYDGRTGDVGVLAISPDGQRALFDHADELRVINLIDGTIEGILHSRYGQFRNLALVVPMATAQDPNANLVLTTTAQGRLQLLTMPATEAAEAFFRQGYRAGFRKNSLLALGMLSPYGGVMRLANVIAASAQPKTEPLPAFRLLPGFPTLAAPQMLPLLALELPKHEGLAAIPELWRLGSYELRNLKTADGAGVTCGAFAPAGGTIFTAGADRVIRLWAPPDAQEQQESVEAVLTYVGGQAETTSTPLVRIRAELDNPTNPARRLMPNTKANLTIFPEAVK